MGGLCPHPNIVIVRAEFHLRPKVVLFVIARSDLCGHDVAIP